MDDTFEIRDDEIDVEDIMRQIRENIKNPREKGVYDEMEEIINKPLSALSDSHTENTGLDTDDDLSHDLEYVNSNWDTHAEYYISSHRPIIGTFLVRGRQMVLGEVRRYVDLIVGKQTEFNAHIVHLINKLSGRIEKVGSEIQSVSQNVQELEGKVNTEIQSVSQNVQELKNEIATIVDEKVTNVFETINTDLENKAWLASLFEKRIELHKQSLLNDINESDNDMNYFVFNEYIGKAWSELSGDSVIDVPNVFEKSLELFNGCKNVLEIGCGNGTFLQMLKDKGIRGYGIDINEDFILYCKRKDLKVENVDVLTHLKSLPDKTIDGVFSAHVIEHLQTHKLIKLIELCYAKMEFGSYIVLVTPNILNIIVSSNTFYMDPTHINHIHPDVLKYLLESGGFREVQKIFYQQVPDELKLKQINCDVDQTIEDTKIFETMNYNIGILNNLLFGYRDFVMVAKK